MIGHLDVVLRRVLLGAFTGGPPSESRVRFQAPDGDWRQYVAGLGAGLALNVYLVDLRENRKLRSNERIRSVENGIATDIPAPRRVDCHYLITAWSAATPSVNLDPTPDEHTLLYEVTRVLMDHQPLVPKEILPPLPIPTALTLDPELETKVLPGEGFPKYAEFWGTMGAVHPWKPAVYLTVTVPVVQLVEISGPLVTTSTAMYPLINVGTVAGLLQIGGVARDNSGQPVAGAWLRIETPAAEPVQITETDQQGRFTFVGLAAGTYTLRLRAVGLGERTRDVDVPSPSGEYDLSFT
jgi:Pvc16 N-terminal domain/Carboxypeptidase regulatory-like domain